jgi:hypothetical protein
MQTKRGVFTPPLNRTVPFIFAKEKGDLKGEVEKAIKMVRGER